MCDDSGVIQLVLFRFRYSKESAAVCSLTAHCALISVAFNNNFMYSINPAWFGWFINRAIYI